MQEMVRQTWLPAHNVVVWRGSPNNRGSNGC